MAFPINFSNLLESTLDDWMNEFWVIYKDHDTARGLLDMWAMTAEDASKVGEGIREGDPKKTLVSLAHAFCWASSFAGRLFKDDGIPNQFRFSHNFPEIQGLSDILWYKYPRICPRCVLPGCNCPLMLEGVSESNRRRKLEQRRQSGPKPQTIEEWEVHFGGIYDRSHHLMSLNEIGFHYEEEVGEVFRAIRRLNVPMDRLSPDELTKRQENLIEEIADVISWTLSLVRQFSNQATEFEKYTQTSYGLANKFKLVNVLWDSYQNKAGDGLACPICTQRPCKPQCDTVD